jgi:hypothetical protein
LKQTKKNEITFRGKRYAVPSPVTTLAETFNTMMKLEPARENENFLSELSVACDVQAPPAALCDEQLMTWDQIRECAEHGITIGAHTHTHRVLATLDLETQKQELMTSKQILEEKLDRPVRSLAYPVGGYEHFNLETMQLARECGYDLAFSFLTGVNDTSTISSYDIKRLDRQNDSSIYTGVFAMPWLFGKRSCAMMAPRSRDILGSTKE